MPPHGNCEVELTETADGLLCYLLAKRFEEIGATLGGCWLHSRHRMCAVNIPKAASTSLDVALLSAEFEFHRDWQQLVPPGWETFAVLRNPYERFLSGVREIARRMDPEPDLDDWCVEVAARLRVMEKIPLVDPHLVPQYLYLPTWLPVTSWFTVENMGALNRWLRRKGVPARVGRKNRTSAADRLVVRERFEPMRDLIDRLYHLDWRLYRTVQCAG